MIAPIWDRACAWPARRPLVVLFIATALAVLAALAVSRLRISGRVEAMLGAQEPSAAALATVMDRFHATDDLLVMATLPADAPADPRPLLAFAQRLEHAVAESPSARAMCRAVSYRRDQAIESYLHEVVFPAGLFYLDDPGLAEAWRRLSPEGMREQFRRNEAMIAAPGPAAGALAKALLRDPLRLHELAVERLGALGEPAGTDSALSEDGRSLLIRLSGARPVSDLEFARAFTDETERIIERAAPGDLQILISGGYAIAAHSAASIRTDMISSTIGSVVLIHLICLAGYRRVAAPVFVATTAACGILWGFGLFAVLRSELTPLTAVVSTMLAGLGVDYGVHYLARFGQERAAGLSPIHACERTGRAIAPGLLAACGTTAVGILAVARSDVRMLRDFSLLAALGLAGALVAALTVLPSLLSLRERLLPSPAIAAAPGGRLFLRWIAQRPWAWIAISLTIFVASLVYTGLSPGGPLRFESDLAVMHPRPSPPLEAQDQIDERFPGAASSLLVLIEAPISDELLARAHDAQRALRDPTLAGAGIVGVAGLADLVPDPRRAERVRGRLATLDRDQIERDFRAAVAESIFDPAAFEPYVAFLRSLISTTPPTLADVERYPALAAQLLGSPRADGGTHHTVVAAMLRGSLRDRDRRDATIRSVRAAIADVPGATLTGLSVIAHDVEMATRRDLPRSLAIACMFVLAWLALFFRRASHVLLSLLPVLFGGFVLVAAMRLTGQRLNTASFIALPLLAGLGADSGIMLVSAARAHRRGPGLIPGLAATCRAILLTSATTAAAFGTLIWTHTPAIASLGWAVAVGIAAVLWGSVFLLAPLLARQASLREPRAPEDHP